MCFGPIVSLQHALKTMARMKSPRIQCTLCAFSVFSAMFGMFMFSAGICIVLNFNLLEVDTSGLPPDLRNENGKKIVGIILICVGIAALGLSGLVSFLYFSVCAAKMDGPSSSSSTGTTSEEQSLERGEKKIRRHHHHHGNSNGAGHGPVPGTSSGKSGALPSGRKAGATGVGTSLPPIRKIPPGFDSSRFQNGQNNTPPGSSRPRPKSRHPAAKAVNRHSRYHNSLSTHKEEPGVEQQVGSEAGFCISSGVRVSSVSDSVFEEGQINYGAMFNEDDFQLNAGATASTPCDSPLVVPRVLITSHFDNDTATFFPNSFRADQPQLSKSTFISVREAKSMTVHTVTESFDKYKHHNDGDVEGSSDAIPNKDPNKEDSNSDGVVECSHL